MMRFEDHKRAILLQLMAKTPSTAAFYEENAAVVSDKRD